MEKMMNKDEYIKKVLQKDRLIVLSLLLLVTSGAWFYLLYMSHGMAGMGGMGGDSPRMPSWGISDITFSFIMWSVMMVAMMLPSAIPMILMFTSANRMRAELSDPLITTGIFVTGYLIIWVIYSALATLAQWGLHGIALLLPTMAFKSPILGGVFLVAVGVFQWTPFRDACITKCRSPIGFIMAEWRDGKAGALIMGLRHGSYCVGCCWLLMGVSLFLGVMNLTWMAALTVFLILEKSEVAGLWLSRIAGMAFIVWGFAIIGGLNKI